MISEKAKRYYRLGVRAKDLRIFTDKTTIMNNGYSTWVIEDTKTNRLIGRGNIYSCTKFKGELKRLQHENDWTNNCRHSVPSRFGMAM